MTTKILDLRHEQTNPFPYKKSKDGATIATSKIVKGKTFERDPKTITGIVVHQTACVFGPSNDIDRRNRRALGIPAHAVAFRDGTVVLPCPLSWYLYTSNDFNQFSLGLECEGQYPGLLDDPRTPKREDETSIWKGASPTPLDAQAIESFRSALTRLYEEGRSLGMPLQYVWAHRQSNGQKPSDPGQEIWQRVVLDHAVKVLGLKTQPSLTMRDGRPIPRAWEPDNVVPLGAY
jgi:hypothetical protein